MESSLRAHISGLLDAGDRKSALALLLEAAPGAPLDDDLHLLLEQAVVEHPLRLSPPMLDLPEGVDSLATLRPFLPDKPEDRGFVLYGLPELLRVEPALLALPPLRSHWGRHPDHLRFGVPERVGISLPLDFAPSYPGLDRCAPEVRGGSGVLTLRQCSTRRYKDGDKSREECWFVVYRVRGSLLHLRETRDSFF